MPHPEITYLDSYISDGQKAVMSLKNFYDTMLVSDVDNRDHIIRVPIDDFFVKYYHQLTKIVEIYELPQRYFYKPKMVSLELYETTEVWLGLLRLNNMKNITEFHEPLIYVYRPGDFKNLVSIFFKREGKIT